MGCKSRDEPNDLWLADDIVASLLQIMDQIGSLDSSHNLQSILVNRFYLVLHAYFQTCDVIFFAKIFLASKHGLT